MSTVTVPIRATIGDTLFSGNLTVVGETPIGTAFTFPVAATGTLTTRTDQDTATLTMTAGHGLVTVDLVDVYWPTGVRRGMEATVTVNSVVVDGGEGDALPTATTALKVGKVTEANVDFDPTIVKLLLVSPARRGNIVFMADDVEVLPLVMSGGYVNLWMPLGDEAPLGTDLITSVRLSNGDSDVANRIAFGVVLDSVE